MEPFLNESNTHEDYNNNNNNDDLPDFENTSQNEKNQNLDVSIEIDQNKKKSKTGSYDYSDEIEYNKFIKTEVLSKKAIPKLLPTLERPDNQLFEIQVECKLIKQNSNKNDKEYIYTWIIFKSCDDIDIFLHMLKRNLGKDKEIENKYPFFKEAIKNKKNYEEAIELIQELYKYPEFGNYREFNEFFEISKTSFKNLSDTKKPKEGYVFVKKNTMK